MMITIESTVTDETVTVDSAELAEAIRPWYPEAPSEVLRAIAELQAGLDRGDYTGGLEAFLAVRIRRTG